MTSFHSLRPVTPLDGQWDFRFLGPVDFDSARPLEPGEGHQMSVPSAFDDSLRYVGERGVAVYQTRVDIPPGHPARLWFGAVSMRARVLVDGVALAENENGYAPFAVEVPPSRQTRRWVTVIADNRLTTGRTPMHEAFFDFYQYGGILRAVRLDVLPSDGSWIDRVEVTPGEGYRHGEVDVCIVFGNALTLAAGRLALQFDDGHREEFALPPRGGEWRRTLAVPHPRLWSPDSPALHRLRVTLLDAEGSETDDCGVRFGLRRIEARDGQLWLNGSPLRLRGYNRHEWHPNYGPCTPTLQMALDLDLLRDLGCNFVRGAHYPQDQRFLDLCDELGFLVWEENLGWQNSMAALAHPQFRADHDKSLRAMVTASYNHPCVIIWGFLNEAFTDSDELRPLLEEITGFLRERDPSRLVSYASRLAETDRHFDLVDVIAINLYPGWYECADADRPLDLIRPCIDRCFASIDRRGFADKPIIVSRSARKASTAGTIITTTFSPRNIWRNI